MILMIFLFIFATLFCCMRRSINSKYRKFASPGPCFPIIGHCYKLMTKQFRKDPVNQIWKIYKKYQKKGILYFNLFGTDLLWIGDFETIKFIFSHPDGNGRMDEKLDRIGMSDRKVGCKQFPGVILSKGDTWQQQRRW